MDAVELRERLAEYSPGEVTICPVEGAAPLAHGMITDLRVDDTTIIIHFSKFLEPIQGELNALREWKISSIPPDYEASLEGSTIMKEGDGALLLTIPRSFQVLRLYQPGKSGVKIASSGLGEYDQRHLAHHMREAGTFSEEQIRAAGAHSASS